jgi:hypothetical protein
MSRRKMSAARTRCRPDDERGVVILLVALLMIAMLIMVAIVIDLGRLRSDRRSDQTISDLAALAAGFYMSGRGSTIAISNPRAGCQAAVTSAQTNQPAFSASNAACDVFPTNAQTGCATNTAPQDAVMSGGGFTLTVRYPVPDSEIRNQTGQRYDYTANDGVDPANTNLHQCERMKVSFSSTSPASFAKVVGVNDLGTSASATLKAGTSQTQQGVAALLLLERVGCGTLQNSGQGAVDVQASGPTNPGVIQADSAGVYNQTAPITCGNNNNGNAPNWTVYGPPLPQSSGGGPSILVEPSTNGQPGIIGVYSLNVGGRGGAVYPGGLSSAPVGSGIASRVFADVKYNKSLATGGNAQISQLHADGYFQTVHMGWGVSASTGAQGRGFTLRIGPSPQECNGYNNVAAPPIDTKIFVDCSDFAVDQAIFPNATDIVFTGKISIGSNKTLSMPRAQRVFVRGETSGNPPRAVDIKSGGVLLVNTGENTIPSPSTNGTTCASRPGPGVSPGSTFTNTTMLATFSGAFSAASGFVRLCQTFVYVGDNNPSYGGQNPDYTGTRFTVTANQQPTENYPIVANCTVAQPCPKDNVAATSFISITGGANVGVEWTSPNQLATQPTNVQLAYPNGQPFEDLALWTENSSIDNVIKGQGANSTTGVYFIPNGSAIFTGQASQSQPLNAQFIVRALNISGQGQLTLKPNPADAIVTPIPGAIQIIR